jgi:hypothetical protein
MVSIFQTLKETEPLNRILGKVEIETIIKKIKGKKLKQTERNYLSRSIRPKLMAASILSQKGILEMINKPKKVNIKNQIIFNLSVYGYDLVVPYKIKKQQKLSIYELIVKILVQEPSVRFIEAIPIILIKNKVNVYTLLEYAAKHGLKNRIGYLLQTSLLIAEKFKLSEINYLKELLTYFQNTKDDEVAFLTAKPDDEYYIEFLEKTSPDRVKEWNLVGRFFDKDFISNARTYLK